MRPHDLGTMTLPGIIIVLRMVALIIAEVGDFGLLFWGFLHSVWFA